MRNRSSPAIRCSSVAPVEPISRMGIPARAQCSSIFNRLLKLPKQTLVYPAHDYKGETVSTIGEEKAFNPRLRVQSVEHSVELMNNLKLPNPKMMDVAVPANTRIGLSQGEVARRGSGGDATIRTRDPPIRRGDRRYSRAERTRKRRHGSRCVARALRNARRFLRPQGGHLHQTALAKKLIFVCTFGERSAMAVQLAQAVGLHRTRHLHGGLAEWRARNQSFGFYGLLMAANQIAFRRVLHCFRQGYRLGERETRVLT